MAPVRDASVSSTASSGKRGATCLYESGLGWGSFAAGAAVGAVGAAAAYDHPDTVVIAPSTGGYINTLPSNCYAVDEGGTPLYNCDGVYYQPTYQGSSLMYEAVQP